MTWLRAKEAITAMWNGAVYSFGAGEHKPVEEDAALHLLKKPQLERADGPASEKPVEPVLCPLCDKDFSEAAKPEYSVLQHIRAAHPSKEESEKEEKKESKPKKESRILE